MSAIAEVFRIPMIPRPLHRWRVVWVSAMALFFGPIPISIFSFGVFLGPWAHDFHVGRGALSAARLWHSMVLPLGLPFAGRLLDRYGARRVILSFAIASGLVLLACGAVRTLLHLYIFFVALGLATCGVAPVQYAALVSHAFDRRRGLALGLTMLGLGLGALVTPVAAQYLIDREGWRLTLSFFGAASLLITVPAIAIFLRDTPAARLEPSKSVVGVEWRAALKSHAFWLTFGGFLLIAANVQACLAHLASILADRGSSHAVAALATSVFGGGVLAGRSGSGYLLDRFFAPRVAAVVFGLAAVGTGLLRVFDSAGIVCAAAFCIGLGLGAEVDIMAYLASRYFGLRAFGTIYGFMFAGYALAGGLGTYLMGVSYDATSSYAFAVDLGCLSTAAGALAMMRLGPYPYQPGANSFSPQRGEQ